MADELIVTPRVPAALHPRFRGAFIAPPKTGKTGAIAALVNSGRFRVIYCAFDPGWDMLLQYVEPEHMHNLLIFPFEDKRHMADPDERGVMSVKVLGEPKAYLRFLNLLETGTGRLCRQQGGEVIELGDPELWDDHTIVVVDNMTPLSKAANERYLYLAHKTATNRRRKDWGLVQDDIDAQLMMMVSSRFSYHVILLAHWKIQGPQEPMDDDKSNQDKVDFVNELREREAELIPTKMVPRAIGRVLSETLLQHYTSVFWGETDANGKRIINLRPSAGRDSGVPVRPGTLPDTLPIETGLLTIFEAVTGL